VNAILSILLNYADWREFMTATRKPVRISGLLFLLLLMLLPVQVRGEETLGFGLSGGMVAGNGFSVRRMPLTGFGWQAGGILLKTASETYFNLGGEYLYVLNRTQSTSLYLAGGLAYIYESNEKHVWDDSQRRYNTEDDIKRGVAGGAGVGIAIRFTKWEQMWFSGDLMLTAYRDTVLPSPQVAIHYFFR
jgi:hypothetical protein